MTTQAVKQGYQASDASLSARLVNIPRLWLRLMLVIALAAGLAKLLDMAFVELNVRKIILPRFDVRLMPYHDPRFTVRVSSISAYQRLPQIVFTGDSRTKNGFDPEVIAEALGVSPETFFNYGTGSQVLSFAREVFIPHLQRTGVQPQYLVFGVTPDWLLNRKKLRHLIDHYHGSFAYRMSQGDSGENDRVEAALSFFLARQFALYRYRADLISREIVPDLRCIFLRDCDVRIGGGYSMPYKEVERLDGIQTRYGWSPQAWDGRTSGKFESQARFGEKDQVDRENLIGLIDQVRRAGMRPVFIRMPLHPSFWEAHQPALSRIFGELEEVAAQERIDLLIPPGDYSDAQLFVDGHHLSRRGAAYFSRDIAPSLSSYLRQSSAANNPALKMTDERAREETEEKKKQ